MILVVIVSNLMTDLLWGLRKKLKLIKLKEMSFGQNKKINWSRPYLKGLERTSGSSPGKAEPSTVGYLRALRFRI